MPMTEQPLHQSPSSARSLWQAYRIFADRLELLTWYGTWSIPFDEIEACEVAEPLLKALVNLRADLARLPRGIKLDLADFNEHVMVDRSTGLIRRILFTPEDPQAFQAALERALAAHRRRRR
jgi:hypothetical protein